MEAIKKDAKDRMERAVANLDHDFSKLRTGRASAALFDDIRVEYYGQMTPLGQLATVAVPDSRTVTIQPWDRNAFGAVEKAILKSDLGFNPVNDGRVLRIVIPALTEERRKELVKVAKKYTEENKVAIRNVRRDANDALKKMEKDKLITEDDMKRAQDEIQKLTDGAVAKADARLAAKEKEIMEI